MRMIFGEEVREAASSARRSVVIGVLVAVLVSALVIPARARARAIPSAPPVAGPALAGDRVLWATPIATASGGFTLRQATLSGPASTVARFRAPRGANGLFPQLAASPSRIVIAATEGDPDTPWSLESVYTAPVVGGAFETLDRDCNLGGAAQVPRTADVSGELVVYWRCAEQPRGVVIRDYSISPPAEEMIPGARPLGLRLAGRYVAWLEDCCGSSSIASGIAVYDRVSRSIAYEIPKAAMPGELNSLDLQSDGTVAFSTHLQMGLVARLGGLRSRSRDPTTSPCRAAPVMRFGSRAAGSATRRGSRWAKRLCRWPRSG
jgi:hypothetical protein